MIATSLVRVFLLSFISLLHAVFVGAQEIKKQELLVCGDTYVLIVDYQHSHDSIPMVVWKWDAREAVELPEIYQKTYFKSVDDSKSVSGGKQILISSSSGGVALVNRADKRVLFYTYFPNAHSIELLPDNRIVVAGSTAANGGNCVAVYNINKPANPVFKDSLYSGHGVVWDTKRQKLYALGYDQLRQYILQDWATESPKLRLEKKWKIPGISGHDLQMSPEGDELFLTETENPWTFNLKTFEFNKLPALTGISNVKSFGRHPERGQLIYTVPEESWWTFHVKFLNPARSLAFPGMHVYKARWVSDRN